MTNRAHKEKKSSTGAQTKEKVRGEKDKVGKKQSKKPSLLSFKRNGNARPPDGKAVKGEITRYATEDAHNDKVAYSSAALDDKFADRGENHEDIGVIINPYALAQYVAGVIYSLAAATDRPVDTFELARMFTYYFANFNNLDQLGVNVWPKAFLELAYSLRPRKIGRFNYVPIWDAVESSQNQYASLGKSAYDCFGFYTYYTNAGQTSTGGFLQPVSVYPGIPTDYEVNAWQAAHCDQLDLVRIIEGVSLDTGDASAFAFDLSPPALTPTSGTLTNTEPMIVSKFGFTGSLDLFANVNSSVGLETKILRPHLAKIRLGTPSPSYGGWLTPSLVVLPVRSPSYTCVVRSLPATMGARYVTKGMGKDPQLKLVSARNVISAMVYKMEIAVKNYSGILAYLGPKDLQSYCASLFRRVLRRYAGVEIAHQLYFPNSNNLSPVDPYYLHSDDTVFEMARVPEPVARVLGSFTAYFDEIGALLPLFTLTDYSTITTSSTYTGTSTYTFTGIDQLGQRMPVLGAVIVAKFKQLEATMAGVCNMRYLSQIGPSLLDCTMLMDKSQTTYTGILSRRAIGGPFLSRIMVSAFHLSYKCANEADSTQSSGNPGFFTNIAFNGQTLYDHSYRQRFRRDLAGYDTQFNLFTIGNYDGFVNAGTLASNMSGNDGPDTGTNALDPASFQSMRHDITVPEAAVSDMRSLTKRWRDYVLPTYGKYCGQNYSAGEYGNKQLMKNGKFLVGPIDAVDAVCKSHDEGYVAAGEDQDKLDAADNQLKLDMAKVIHEGKGGAVGPLIYTLFDLLGQRKDWKQEL